MPRIKEVLETHDWTGPGDLRDPDADQELDFVFDDDLEAGLLGGSKSRTRGFGQEVQELEREMLGLRMAIEHGGGDGEEGDFGDFEDGDDEIKVESMEGLMMRVQAIKGMLGYTDRMSLIILTILQIWVLIYQKMRGRSLLHKLSMLSCGKCEAIASLGVTL